jgi:dihydroxyacid dehydratase/phosphogluconate dehydratase
VFHKCVILAWQTVTGKTLAENLKDLPDLSPGQEIIMPVEKPIKKTGHLQILYGNLSPVGPCRGGSVIIIIILMVENII